MSPSKLLGEQHVVCSVCRKDGQVVSFSSLSELRFHTVVENPQELMNFLNVEMKVLIKDLSRMAWQPQVRKHLPINATKLLTSRSRLLIGSLIACCVVAIQMLSKLFHPRSAMLSTIKCLHGQLFQHCPQWKLANSRCQCQHYCFKLL